MIFKGNSTVAKSLFWKMWTSSEDSGVKSTVTINKASGLAGVAAGTLRQFMDSELSSKIINKAKVLEGMKTDVKDVSKLTLEDLDRVKNIKDGSDFIDVKKCFKNNGLIMAKTCSKERKRCELVKKASIYKFMKCKLLEWQMIEMEKTCREWKWKELK
jgi:hypothetical protein